jgi:hypothetical protein
MKYWINTISRDHVRRGIVGGFTQANHGRRTVLQRLRTGDKIIFYSPKTLYEGGETLQAFTALGMVADDNLYQGEMAAGFVAWRRNLIFETVTETSIKPLINDLSFITDKTHWGYKFRFGLFEIPAADYQLIAAAMQKAHTKGTK